MLNKKYKYMLFISGMSIKSVNAVDNIKRIFNEYLKDQCELKIVDVSKEREKAAEYQIFALPTLIKFQPSPMRTVLGDLSDKQKVLKILDIA